MIPLSLITGFLGSGKTTFLKRFAQRHADRKIVYLVNEFSPADIDGHVLADSTDDLIALPGGSVFCRCLVTEFIRVLKEIPERFGEARDGRALDGVVIEASGVANPMVVEQMLAETQLDQAYALSSVVSIVEPGTFGTLLETLPNITAQIQASDTVVINKTDLYGPEILDETEDRVRELNPRAEVVRATYCEADLALFGEGKERRLRGEYAKCVDPNFARFSVKLKQEIDADALRALVRGIEPHLYRLKGFARVDGEMKYLDYTPAGLTIERSARQDEVPILAFIVNGAESEPGQELAQRIKAGDIYAGADTGEDSA